MQISEDEKNDVRIRILKEVDLFLGEFQRRLKRHAWDTAKADLELNGFNGRTKREVADAAFAKARELVLDEKSESAALPCGDC